MILSLSTWTTEGGQYLRKNHGFWERTALKFVDSFRVGGAVWGGCGLINNQRWNFCAVVAGSASPLW